MKAFNLVLLIAAVVFVMAIAQVHGEDGRGSLITGGRITSRGWAESGGRGVTGRGITGIRAE